MNQRLLVALLWMSGLALGSVQKSPSLEDRQAIRIIAAFAVFQSAVAISVDTGIHGINPRIEKFHEHLKSRVWSEVPDKPPIWRRATEVARRGWIRGNAAAKQLRITEKDIVRMHYSSCSLQKTARALMRLSRTVPERRVDDFAKNLGATWATRVRKAYRVLRERVERAAVLLISPEGTEEKKPELIGSVFRLLQSWWSGQAAN